MNAFISHILKTFAIPKKKSFFFSILNETHKHVPYDRAYLWQLEGKKPKLIGASGATSVAKVTPSITRMRLLIMHLKKRESIQILEESNFIDQHDRWGRYTRDSLKPNGVWVPLQTWGKYPLGLWLERWGGKAWGVDDLERLEALAACYGATYEKFKSRHSWRLLKKRSIILPIILFIFLVLMIRIPLRVVGPAEVISEDPVRVGAPLDGVIQTIDVKPGAYVNAGTVLFSYDKTIALNELYVAEKQVEIARSELHRLTIEALKSKGTTQQERESLLLQINAQQLELKKEEIKLALARHNADLLEVKAPVGGVISMQDPEKWEGRAVLKGEEVMLLNDPAHTIAKIWLPEDDLVPLNPEKKAEIFLNIRPEKKMTADVFYISDKSILTEQGIPSFIVEAAWNPPLEEQPQLGLKGTAILYGENVSLFYWIIRRPWATVRRFLGV